MALEDIFSGAGLMNCGVPQESILGPLLLLLTYINNLPQPLSEAESYLYADHTFIFYQDKVVGKIEKILNKELPPLSEWFINNKLSVHFWDNKTKGIIFPRKESPTKTEHIIRKLFSEIAQYYGVSQLLS